MPQDKLEQALLRRGAKIAPEEDEYREKVLGPTIFDLLNKPMPKPPVAEETDNVVVDNIPKVPRHPSFEPEPVVIGSPKFLKAAQYFLNMAPALRTKVKNITEGHTRGSMQMHMKDKLRPDDFGQTNLYGVFDRRNKEIGIRPNLPEHDNDFGMYGVLAHELAHSTGHPELVAEKLGTNLGKFLTDRAKKK